MKPKPTPEEKAAKASKCARSGAISSMSELHWVLGNFVEFMGVSDVGILPIGGKFPDRTYHGDGITIFKTRKIHAFVYWGRVPYSIGVVLYEVIKDKSTGATYYRDFYHKLAVFSGKYVSGGGFWSRTKDMDRVFKEYIDTYPDDLDMHGALKFESEVDAAFWFGGWETPDERVKRYKNREKQRKALRGGN